MKNSLAFLSFLVCSITLSGCGSDPKPKIEPSNLVVEETISTDGSGLVTFVATAENTVKFTFSFGDGTDMKDSSDGTASHNYANSGTYTAKVFAYSADNLSINKSITVTIKVNEPTISNAGYSTPDSYPGMTLVWNDEFGGYTEPNPLNYTLNADNWTHETGNNNGWGNNELEYYQAENTIVENGYLTIKANKEASGSPLYTSSRFVSKGKKEFKYGRVDIRAILPKGQGIWPALWMLGSNISDVGWPKCGEIDIMEMIGGTPERDRTVFGTLHWDNAGSHACTCDKPGHSLSSGAFNDEFHVFTMTWDQSFITWYVDDVQFNKISITPAELDEFQKSYFFIFNLAVGGAWPGNPDATTIFPQRLIVDYIRVFQ